VYFEIEKSVEKKESSLWKTFSNLNINNIYYVRLLDL
jgi:hypothetical protein